MLNMNYLSITSQTTNGITVTASPLYVGDQSNAQRASYAFSYHIDIYNSSGRTIKLLSRFWKIFDAMYGYRTVEGEGVVGETPVIANHEVFSYSSWCPLHSPIGSMEGHYTVLDVESGKSFIIAIPKFLLWADFMSN